MRIILFSCKTSIAVLLFSIITISNAQAAVFSSTAVELLHGYDYRRGPGSSEVDESIFSISNSTGFTKGDTFFFADFSNIDDRDNTGGTHAEFRARLSLLRAFGLKKWDGVIKDVYAVAQGDFDSNRFVSKFTTQTGISLDWNVPGFKFVKTHLQYRDDPTLDGSSVQFTLNWNSHFKIAKANFSFEGFADWTSSEGGNSSHLLTQPQLLWHINKQIAVGFEYQYWKNRLGISGLDEKAPQIMLRWTF